MDLSGDLQQEASALGPRAVWVFLDQNVQEGNG